MKFYIEVEDLAANALMAMLAQNSEERFIPYVKMQEYGMQVLHYLKEGGDKGVFIFSRNNVYAMLNDYSDFFEEQERNGEEGLFLRKNKNLDDLIQAFVGRLPFKLFMAFYKANDAMFKVAS